MEYITHTKYKGKSITGEDVMLSRGKKLSRKGELLFFKDKPICIYRSEVARSHFAINDDGNGLIRGDLTHKIAYSANRVEVDGWLQRFNEKQKDILCSDKWSKFLNPEHDVIIFADCFFDADIEELKTLYKKLEECSDV